MYMCLKLRVLIKLITNYIFRNNTHYTKYFPAKPNCLIVVSLFLPITHHISPKSFLITILDCWN